MSDDPYLRLPGVGHCQVLSRLGEGGMGVVYRGRHKDLDLDVAIKFLHPHLIQKSGAADRFIREARLAARLHSPGIVRVFDCGEVEGNYYMVMELIEGQTLEVHLGERITVPISRALQITEAVARALQEALEQIGLIHRDVKPANILITRCGQVKLADLGLAKIIAHEAATAYTAAGVALGTPSYMPPEQFTDASQVDHRADIYSLGATLYQMLSGRAPFRGDSFFRILKQVEESEPDPLPAHIPEAIRELIVRMLAKQPEHRFQEYGELLDALHAVQGSLGDTDEHVKVGSALRSTPLAIPRKKGPERAVFPGVPVENRVLLIVDVQNDFCPDGALAVPGGDQVVAIINKLARRFTHVIATQNWHGEDHLAFASSHPGKKPHDRIALSYGEQVLWPDHCIAGTPGAEFHAKLDLAQCELVIRKGCQREIDSYSAFFENDRQTPTGLAGYLRERGLTRLFIVGLALDSGVASTALDARRLGFEVTVIEAGCRGRDDDEARAAWIQMEEAGVVRA